MDYLIEGGVGKYNKIFLIGNSNRVNITRRFGEGMGKYLEIYLYGILKICEVGIWVGNLNEAFI